MIYMSIRSSMAQRLQAMLTAELTGASAKRSHVVARIGVGQRASLKINSLNNENKEREKMSSTMGQTNLGSSQTHRSQGESQMSQGQQHSEGTVARTIEQQTAKLPSDVFLWAAVGSMGASAIFQLMGKKHASLFVGDWVAPLLLFGVYNKIVKTQGSDRSH